MALADYDDSNPIGYVGLPDPDFAMACDTIEEIHSWGDYALTGIPQSIHEAEQHAWEVIAQWEAFMLSNVTRGIQCSSCDHCDDGELGDYHSCVATCSHCDILVCGKCWDRLHAETCGDGGGE